MRLSEAMGLGRMIVKPMAKTLGDGLNGCSLAPAEPKEVEI